ncbi:hypothetical protein [Rhodococcus sp. IEGM 1330]|uniref:hypothetical protein n=1 Tax=Rhodococcus sp. IEGM 1330 TaxID=3082225 RepID=UPI0029547289|nr:hypothetical protein [Rhodococcus sp. IEGM 1330]MDV8025339.1 hypothetical protein [Rhodococcus sp. IEGM 1330]
MSELDLGLKVGVRRLFWSMGMSTRLDVELRGFAPTSGAVRKGPAESFTDLDVLGVAITGSHQTLTEIADCKTTRRDSTSRMFWVRGVADLFGASHAYLVREHDVTDAAKQLSSRLGVTVLPSDDLQIMQKQFHENSAEVSADLSFLFDKNAVSEHLNAFNGLDRRLKRLLDYRQFDYWIFEDHRNPVQMISHLQGVRDSLDPKNPIHVGLFLDLSWLYLLSLVKVTQHVRGSFLRDPDRGIQEYLFGGAINLREKELTATLINQVNKDPNKPFNHLPDYYKDLRELTTRLMRRPGRIQTSLRYAEAATSLSVAKKRTTLQEIFKSDYDPIAAKLIADVCGFLVAAAGLDNGFRTRARAYLLAETPEAHQGQVTSPLRYLDQSAVPLEQLTLESTADLDD